MAQHLTDLQPPESKNPAEAGFFKKLKLTDKPGSVVDSHSSRPAIAHWLKQPTRVQYGPYHVNPYLALLRVEFTVPRTVTSRAVRSYRTLSPLPDPTYVGHRRFALCCTGRGLAPPRRYLAPCPMEPGLSSPPPVSPERDDDEAATVWSASARSIEGLRAAVTFRCRQDVINARLLPLPVFRSSTQSHCDRPCPDHLHATPASSPSPPRSAAAVRLHRGTYRARSPDL